MLYINLRCRRFHQCDQHRIRHLIRDRTRYRIQYVTLGCLVRRYLSLQEGLSVQYFSRQCAAVSRCPGEHASQRRVLLFHPPPSQVSEHASAGAGIRPTAGARADVAAVATPLSGLIHGKCVGAVLDVQIEVPGEPLELVDVTGSAGQEDLEG